MKNIKPTIYTTAIALSALTLSSHGALVFNDLWTDASGNLAPGTSWSGAASDVQASAGIDPATLPLAVSPGTSLLLDNTAGGTLNMGTATGFGTNVNGASASMALTLASGTADFSFSNTWWNIPSVSGAQSLFVNDLQGVSSFMLEFNFDAPIAATGNGGLANSPMLAGITTIGSNLQITAEYLGVTSSTDGGLTFDAGLPTGAVGDGMQDNELAFAANSTSGSINPATAPFLEWQGINGFDVDGTAGFDVASEGNLVYATGIKYTISSAVAGVDLAANSQFYFSINGTQYANVANAAVPEPSSSILLLLSGLCFLNRRKR